MPQAISRAWRSEEPKAAWFSVPETARDPSVVTHICRVFLAEVRSGLFFPYLYMYILFPKLHLQVQQWGSGSCAASGVPAHREPPVSPPLDPRTSAPGQLLLFMEEIIPLSFLQLKGSFRKTTREMSNGEFC